MITSAFTCTGPYAILIMLGIKRVENRASCGWPDNGPLGDRPLPVGRAAVSCSKKFCKEEYGNFVQWASRALSAEDFERIPAWSDVKEWPGKIVGCVDYVARERTARGSAHVEAWDEGYRYFWDLDEVVCFDEPIPCRGNTGMWQMPEALAKMVTAADEIERRGDFRVRTPEDVVELFRAALPVVGSSEGFFVLPLDESGCPKSMPVLVSLGPDSTTTAVRLKDVFEVVFKTKADRFLVAHNHPRGTLTPSPEDLRLTRELESVSATLGLKMLDHLILGRDNQFASILKEIT